MRLGEAWGSLRRLLRKFSLPRIKEIVDAAGLPVHELGELHSILPIQQLFDELDLLFARKTPDDQDRIVVNCIRDMMRRTQFPESRADLHDQLSEVLNRVGWGLTSDGEPYRLSLQIDADTTTLDASLRDGMIKCLRRFRDGDPDGALTAVCGVVDTLTARIFSQNPNLGDHRKTPYAIRVRTAFQTCEAKFKNQFGGIASFSAAEINQLWDRQFKSIEQAGEVLAKLRQLSDAHGAQKPPATAIQHGIACAIYVVRIFTGVSV